MTDRELMQQALEALNRSDYLGWQLNIPIIKALRERLAQPEQEPVAYRVWDRMGGISYRRTKPSESEYVEWDALYTAPQPAVPAIPEGMKLVPVEPTDSMLWREEAPFSPWRKCSGCGTETGASKNEQKKFWTAMLAAAPEQPANNFFKQFETGNMRMPAAQPAVREWQGLTDAEREEILELWEASDEWPTFADATRAIEAKLREKNGGK